MKFTLSWLKDHLETEASLDEIAKALTDCGLEVEGVDDPSAKFAAFSVAHVIEAAPHPNADRLKLCRVQTKDGEVQVVCGAPNAKTGMKAVFAAEGTYIPGTGITLKPAEIRGVASQGMLCSERELELSDEHDGIIELDENAEVGTPLAKVMGLDDPIIHIAVTPNRQDCLGVRGIARDLAAKGIGTLKPLDTPKIDGSFDSPVSITLDFPENAKDACPAFASRFVRGVKNGPSPLWLQRRLRAIGLRPISALVDITNYLTIDLGRPLHVYDAAKLKGGLTARLGRRGESFLALNEKTYDVDDTMCVIADDENVLGLGGIMGGEDSGVDENTRDVVVECAYFDPIRTGRTGRRLNIDSDARQRFERGVDPAFIKAGEAFASDMILKLCGGEASRPVLAGKEPFASRQVFLRPERVAALTGVVVDSKLCATILTRLGFDVETTPNGLNTDVPSWRRDIDGEADLVEEVIRIHGYDRIPVISMTRKDAIAKPTLTLGQNRIRRARRHLAARGLNEAITWSFIRESDAKAFGGGTSELRLANPISTDMGVMRPSLLPGLIRAASRNMDRGAFSVRLFEIGAVFENDTPKGQTSAIGLVLAGETGARHWQEKPRGFEWFDAKAEALSALANLGAPVDKVQVSADAPAWYHPGRSGVIRLGPKTVLAVFGELHPSLQKAHGLKSKVAMAEIFPDSVPIPKAAATKTRPPMQVSDLQAVERDFAFVVDESITADQLLRAVKGAEKTFIIDAQVFDIYQGPGVEEGKKSLAVSVTLQPRDATFRDAEIDAIAGKIIANAEKATGARLRA